MKDCCEDKLNELEGGCSPSAKLQARTLKIVFAINFVMFFVEIVWGLLSRSTALMADSLDMLGDAIIYAMSLFVVHRGISAKAKVSFLKGVIMLSLSALIFMEAIWKVFRDVVPESQVMGLVGLLALGANLVCLFLLTRHKEDDLNMKSTWLCSRNDIIANGSVLVAAGLVYLFESKVPDILIGLGIAFIIFRSSLGVMLRARKELNLEKVI